MPDRHPDGSQAPLSDLPNTADRERGLELLRLAAKTMDIDEADSIHVIEQALELALSLNDSYLLARAKHVQSRLLIKRGEYIAAGENIHAALGYTGIDQEFEADLRCDLGRALLNQGQYYDARKQLLLAVGLSGSNSITRGKIYNFLAGLAHATGEYEEALFYLNKAETIFGYLSDDIELVHVLTNLGNILTSCGRYAEALDKLASANTLILKIERSGQSQASKRSHICINLSAVFLDMGDLGAAEQYAQEALELARLARNCMLEANAVLNLASAQQASGNLAQARETYLMALDLAQAGQYRHMEASALDGLGQIMMSSSQWEEARDVLRRAGEIAEATGDTEGQLDALLHLGEVEQKRQAPQAARTALQAALALALEVNRPKAVCDIHRALYQMHSELGEHALALAHLEQLYKLEREIQSAEVEERVKDVTGRFELERAQHQAELSHLQLVAAEEAREVAEGRVCDRTRSLEQAQLEIVTRLALAAEYRDDTTGEHTWRVGQISAAIAECLGLGAEDVELLRVASRLHDVGKIGIPDSILQKPGKLTPEEFSQMQQHTRIGQRILSGGQSRLLKLAEEIALSHHERWAGGGYPNNLSGEQIPLTARIVAVADVFDALTHVRTYKQAWTVGEALLELQNLAGKSFDPQVVAAALQVLPLDESGQPATRAEYGGGVS